MIHDVEESEPLARIGERRDVVFERRQIEDRQHGTENTRLRQISATYTIIASLLP